MAKLKVSNPLDMGGNPPDAPITMEQVASEMYGTLDLPSSNKVVARPVMLTDIKPDVKQPRRIIPAGIRKGWTGDVSKIPDMLRDWRIMAEKALGESLDPVALVSKFTDGREADKDMPAIAEEYLALCALAASINRDGLAYAIQITGRNAPHVIVTGERRYMAHWLLKTLLGPKWESISAVVVNEPDVWLQAAENGNRRSLNAIAFARQLALLIMEMYTGDDGVHFDDIGFFNHEREFYAQVANGNIWRIKKGMGERVLQVTGLTSLAQVNQYRALLSISNELWDEADTNNWTEGRIRGVVRPPHTSTIVEVSNQYDTLNGFKVSPIPRPQNPQIGLQNVPYQSQTPPQPPMVTPKPSPLQYRPPVDLDDDDDVMMDDDNEPIIVRPFGGVTSHDGGMGHSHDIAPSALENEQLMDYQSLLKSFLSTAGRDVAGDMSVLTRGHIRKMREQYTADEIAQILLGWENEISALMEKIWTEAQAFNQMVYDIASKMKGVGDE